MSKKSEKIKRMLEKEKAHKKEAFIPIIAALFFIVLGVAGLFNNSKYLKEYNNSEDIRTVEAIVTDYKLRSETADGNLWFVHLKYDVDGTEYYDTDTIYKYNVEIGVTVNVEVYKRPNGKYVIPEITDSRSLGLKNVLFYISIAVGAVLMLIGIVCLVTALRKITEIQASGGNATERRGKCSTDSHKELNLAEAENHEEASS